MRRAFQRQTLFKIKTKKSVIDVTLGTLVMTFMFGALVVTTFAWNWNGQSHNPGQTADAADQPIAIVDGIPLLRAEYDEELNNMRNNPNMQGTAGPMEMGYMRTYAFQQLVQDKEMIAAAAKMGLTASSAEADQEEDKSLTQNKVRQELGLSADASVGDVEAAVQDNGGHLQSKATYQQMATLDKLHNHVGQTVAATEQDARNSFMQYHTRHILIRNTGRSDAQAQQQANQILAMAKAPGANFEALASKYSEDPGTKAKGGDDGWIDQNTQYVPEFKTAAFALTPGQVTPDLVKSPTYGYFIIKLDDEKENLPPDFDQNKSKYIANVAQERQDQAWSQFVQGLQKAPHDVKIMDPAARADSEMSDSMQIASVDPTRGDSQYRQAIADYQKAIQEPSTDNENKAIAYAQMAHAYDAMKDTADEITAYNNALKAYGSDDAEMLMAVGDLYKKQKQDDLAIADYQRASKTAWNVEGIHTRLMADYTALHRKDLAATEVAWIAQYDKDHPRPVQPAPVVQASKPSETTLGTAVVRNGKVTFLPTAAGKKALGGKSPFTIKTQPAVAVHTSQPASKPVQ